MFLLGGRLDHNSPIILDHSLCFLDKNSFGVVDGLPNDWHVSHLGSKAASGAGLVFAEMTAVLPEGRISASDTGLWNDEQTKAWKRVAAEIKSNGSVAGIQIAHAGRKGSSHKPWVNKGGSLGPDEGAWTTLAPSAIPFGANLVHIPKVSLPGSLPVRR